MVLAIFVTLSIKEGYLSDKKMKNTKKMLNCCCSSNWAVWLENYPFNYQSRKQSNECNCLNYASAKTRKQSWYTRVSYFFLEMSIPII